MSWQAGRCLAGGSLALAVILLMNGTSSAQIPGDVDGNGLLDAADINLVDPLYCGPPGRRDVNEDGVLDVDDRLYWLHALKHTWVGDTNLDGEFNSGDLIQVFAAGQFETGEEARWEQGDWNGDYTFSSGDLVFAFVDGGYEIGPRLLGDYNRNGLLDAGDLDLQALEIVEHEPDLSFDLTGDGEVNFDDRQMWVGDLKKTWIFDANLDCFADSSDMVQVFAAGNYETGEPAGWAEGDFNGDTLFNSSDLVSAFAGRGYEQGPQPGCRSVVPEPAGGLLFLLAMASLPIIKRNH